MDEAVGLVLARSGVAARLYGARPFLTATHVKNQHRRTVAGSEGANKLLDSSKRLTFPV
jgi:hypothetical protein